MLVSLATFTAAALLIVLLPGPDTLVVVRSVLRGGRRQGTLTALGNLCGLTIWVVAAALGLAAMLRASEVGYDALRVLGAAYLVWLGVAAWCSRGAVDVAPSAPGSRILGTGFRAGILTNLLNPKVGVFFIAFLPGFIPAGHAVAGTSVLLGAIFVALTALYWVALLGLSGVVTGWMGTPSVRRRIDTATALVFVGFGIRLATE